MTIFMSLGGFIVGFIRGWEMTLVCMASIPLLVISGALMGKII